MIYFEGGRLYQLLELKAITFCQHDESLSTRNFFGVVHFFKFRFPLKYWDRKFNQMF